MGVPVGTPAKLPTGSVEVALSGKRVFVQNVGVEDMTKNTIVPFAALLSVAFIYGCGGKTSVVTAPTTAGDPAALVNTSWRNPTTNAVYTFKDASTVEVAYLQASGPVQGTYTVKNGVIDITVGFQSLTATWNGKVVSMHGKALIKQ